MMVVHLPQLGAVVEAYLGNIASYLRLYDVHSTKKSQNSLMVRIASCNPVRDEHEVISSNQTLCAIKTFQINWLFRSHGGG